MRRLSEFGLVTLLLIALSGCFEDVPQLNAFTSYLQQETQKDCKEWCRFVSANKTDGQSQGFAGVKMYEMRVNIRVTALQSLDAYGPGAMNGWMVIGPIVSTWQGTQHANQEQTLDIPTILHFQKMESGWKINSISRGL